MIYKQTWDISIFQIIISACLAHFFVQECMPMFFCLSRCMLLFILRIAHVIAIFVDMSATILVGHIYIFMCY